MLSVISWDSKNDCILASGGRMDSYYDDLYIIGKGGFKQIFHAASNEFEEITDGWYLDTNGNIKELNDDSLWDVFKEKYNWNDSVDILNTGKIFSFRECLEYLKNFVPYFDDSGYIRYQDDNTKGSLSEYIKEENEYLENNEYIIYNSDIKLLSEGDLYGFTKQDCKYARNEIYARHGRKFTDDSLKKYFNSKSWYEGYIEPNEFLDSWLSDIEKKNIQFIKEYEESSRLQDHMYDDNTNQIYAVTSFYEYDPWYEKKVTMCFVNKFFGTMTIDVEEWDQDDINQNTLLIDEARMYYFTIDDDMNLSLYRRDQT